MFGGPGFPEMIVVLVIAMVFFGPSKLPSLGQSPGKDIKNFKKGVVKGNAGIKLKIEGM